MYLLARTVLLNQGAFRLAAVITLVCIVMSVLLTHGFQVFAIGTGEGPSPGDLWIPVVVPLAVAFPGAYLTMRLAEKLIHSEARNENLVRELSSALEEVKLLSGLLPICSNCKAVRNESGAWQQIETYVSDHSEAEFSHGLCPRCAEELYPDHKL